MSSAKVSIMLLLSALILSGCGDDCNDRYSIDHHRAANAAQGLCQSHGQEFLEVHMQPLDMGGQWEAICIQKSPYRSFRYVMGDV